MQSTMKPELPHNHSSSCSNLRIGYLPFTLEANAYAARMIDLLKAFGSVEQPPPFVRWLLGPRTRFDLLVLNWFENDMVETQHGAISWRKVLQIFLHSIALHWMARKVIMVRHNVVPHATAPAYRPLVRKLVDALESSCSLSWVHSGHMATQRRWYVPHPLYSRDEQEVMLPDLPAKFFVVFGALKRYKRIEQLLALLPDHIPIVIAGAPSEPQYVEALRAVAGPSVVLIAELLPEPAAAALVRRACATVICHADDDMIVSGSMLFALTHSVPVLALESEYTRWFREHVNGALLQTAPDMRSLVKTIANYNSRHTDRDVLEIHEHHSDASVRSRVAASLKHLGF